MTDTDIVVLDCFGNAHAVGQGIAPPIRVVSSLRVIACHSDGSPVIPSHRTSIGFLTSAGTFSVDPVIDGSPTVRTTGCVGVVEIITEETHMPEHTSLAVRRLTPRECERLMGWPDDWTRYGDDGRELGDTHRYRMCGNGVVSNVAEWIGHRLPDTPGAADD